MKKPLIGVSICAVVLLVLSSIPIVNAGAGKPDLIIEDIKISSTNPFEEEFRCQVKNIGDASTSFEKPIDIFVTLRWKIFNLLPLFPTRQFNGGGYLSLSPNETYAIPFAGTSNMPLFGYYTFYCTINPEGIIEESNYQNNVYSETIFFVLGYSWS